MMEEMEQRFNRKFEQAEKDLKSAIPPKTEGGRKRMMIEDQMEEPKQVGVLGGQKNQDDNFVEEAEVFVSNKGRNKVEAVRAARPNTKKEETNQEVTAAPPIIAAPPAQEAPSLKAAPPVE